MTELRDAERANAPIIYGTHGRMAEREVEIQGVDAWRGKEEGEGREHHFLSSGSKWCLNVSLSGQVIIFIWNQNATMIFL